MLKVVEVFSSIDGEGIRAGYLVTFIRLFGCNCRCSYCDTAYSYDNDEYRSLSIDEVLKLVANKRLSRVTLTGGEPLYQPESKELIHRLLEAGYEVNVETNGSIDLEEFLIDDLNNENLIITMDWKSYSSKMFHKMYPPNLSILRNQDVLKFVVSSEEDLDQMKLLVETKKLGCNIFVSPVFGQIEPKVIVEYLLKNKLNQVRLQLQLHKLIWDVDTRGV